MSWALIDDLGKIQVQVNLVSGSDPQYRLVCGGGVIDTPSLTSRHRANELAKTLLRLPSSDQKPSNPKDAIGSDKLPLHLWPTTATAMGCVGMMEGLSKYGRNNFREHGVRASVYVAACKRHLDAWFEGEDCAPDSGVPHLANALSCLAIIVDAKASGKLNDDRNYRGEGYRVLVEELTPHIRRLREMHKDKDPIHYTIGYQKDE